MRILAGKSSDRECLALDGERIVLDCWTEYVIEAAERPALPEGCLKRELPGDGCWRGLVNFGDYIGLLWLGDQLLEIRSGKLDSDGFDALLQQITDRVSNLPFDINSPSFVPFAREDLNERDRLYHALVYLRWAMWFARPSLEESWAQVVADPHRTLIREERHVTPWDARSIGPRTLERIVSHPETWARIAAGSPLASTALGSHLRDAQGRCYFPTDVVEVVAETCIDNPENRFAKYFIGLARELAERSRAMLMETQGIDQRLLSDAEALAGQLRAMEGADFLRDVGQMQRFPVHSQVLQKRAGYRELLLHHQALVLASRYPIAAEDLRRIIETKSASLLYEYWCFFEVAEQLAALLGRPTEARVSGDDLHAFLAEGIKLVFPGGIELHYNRSFSRANSKWKSYSVPLRPDIVLKVGDTLHLLDAKFRVDPWDVSTELDSAELDALEAADRAGVASKGWWKNADIHKMHAYKDALGSEGAKVATVWVLYPGTEHVFYATVPGALEGVGAVPLTPQGQSVELTRLLANLV
jgi:hypothetical protein